MRRQYVPRSVREFMTVSGIAVPEMVAVILADHRNCEYTVRRLTVIDGRVVIANDAVTAWWAADDPYAALSALEGVL